MANNIVSRKEAQAQGLKRYFTGKPCKHGHLVERTTVNGTCLECVRLSFLLRYRADPEKYLAIAAEERARNGDKIRARKKEKYASDPEKHRKRIKGWRANLTPERRKEIRKESYSKGRDAALLAIREYRLKNPDKVKQQQLSYNQSDRGKLSRRLWAKENKERRLEGERVRRKENPEKRRNSYRKWANKKESEAVIVANAHRRRTRLLNAEGSHTAADLADIMELQGHRCAYCRADLRKVKKHLDHIVPLSRGGSNERSNTQWTCQPCNLTKNARDPIEFAQSLGLLL